MAFGFLSILAAALLVGSESDGLGTKSHQTSNSLGSFCLGAICKSDGDCCSTFPRCTDTGLGHMMCHKEDSKSLLTIPNDMYRGQCPFQSWFAQLPSHFGLWEGNLIGKYRSAWEKAGTPTGIRKNDHDYGTILGQGNTLGFFAAHLTLSAPQQIQLHGLFAETGTLPAVVRFSDFGSDSSTLRLARMAVKVPLKSAWGGEVNLLFTETMDTFPFAGFDELAAFADDASSPWYKRIWNKVKLVGGVLFAIPDAWKVYQAMSQETLAKTYYSQLPYMLGEHQAMKFQLVPKQKTCNVGAAEACCVPKTAMPSSHEAPMWAQNRARVAAAFLKGCDAVFELQLQVKALGGNEFTSLQVKALDAKWDESPVTVGTLTIPKKDVLSDWAVDTKLQAALASELHVEPEGIDKLFAFHLVSTHRDNRPTGEINTFRAAYQSQNAKERFDTIHKGVFRNASGAVLRSVQQMPFKELQQAGVFGKFQDGLMFV